MAIGPTFRAAWRHTPRFVLVVLQVGLTLAVVSNCFTLLLDARRELGRESGFDDDQLIRVGISNWDPDLLADDELAQVVHREDLAAVRAHPRVAAASSTSFYPWIGGGSSTEVLIAGVEMERLRTQTYVADGEILGTLGIELVAGRWWTTAELEADDGDGDGGAPVIVTSAFARLLEPAAGGELLGRELAQSVDDSARYQVIGIVDPFYNPYGWPIHEYALFFPGLRSNATSAAMLVRAEPGQAATVAAELEQLIHARRNGRTATVRRIVETRSAFHTTNRVILTSLYGVMGALLVVTALGIIGLTSLSVTERRRQIGTRRALGASREAIVSWVLLENALVAGCGAALGIGLAWALDIGLAQAVDGARMAWQVPLVGAVAVVVLALLSALAPALRAADVPPAIATRSV
jgi:putative ABC transport system permease protein